MSRPATTQIVLLRGINIGSHNRIAMPPLREALERSGFASRVRSYLQSGNVVLDTELAAAELSEAVRGLLAEEFALHVPVLTRTRDELSAVIALNPLGHVATELKRYQVSFLEAEPAPEVVERLRALALREEAFAAHGRELYGWHPDGIARSKLWGGLADRRLGLLATARNWITVTALLDLADAG